MILWDPFSFLAFSFLIGGWARWCSDTPHISPQITVGPPALQWEQKTIYYIVEGLWCSHFLGKEAKHLQFLVDPVPQKGIGPCSFLPCNIRKALILKCNSFSKCFQVSNSFIQHLLHFCLVLDAGGWDTEMSQSQSPPLRITTGKRRCEWMIWSQPRGAAWWSEESLHSGLKLKSSDPALCWPAV